MGFIMDGLAAEAFDREYTDRQLLTRILGLATPVNVLTSCSCSPQLQVGLCVTHLMRSIERNQLHNAMSSTMSEKRIRHKTTVATKILVTSSVIQIGASLR